MKATDLKDKLLKIIREYGDEVDIFNTGDCIGDHDLLVALDAGSEYQIVDTITID